MSWVYFERIEQLRYLDYFFFSFYLIYVCSYMAYCRQLLWDTSAPQYYSLIALSEWSIFIGWNVRPLIYLDERINLWIKLQGFGSWGPLAWESSGFAFWRLFWGGGSSSDQCWRICDFKGKLQWWVPALTRCAPSVSDTSSWVYSAKCFPGV